jgi:fatty acid desaturase
VRYLFQPLQSLILALTFEWGIALYDLDAAVRRTDEPRAKREAISGFLTKVGRQVIKDYVLFPALAGRRWRQVLGAVALANALRSLWLYVVIVCGHLADGAEKFTPESIDGETRSQWYLRQLLGTANVTAGPVLAFATGHLCYQIEHHLFPDLPSNRYPDIAVQVKALCDKYDLPYNTGSLGRQFVLAQRTVLKLSAPDSFLTATSDDAPETASERRFSGATRPAAGRGLRTALRELRDRRTPLYRNAA